MLSDPVKLLSSLVVQEDIQPSVEAPDYTRCLRSRVIRHSNKVGFVSCTKSDTVEDRLCHIKPIPTHTDCENNYLAQQDFAQTTRHTELSVHPCTGLHATMTLADVNYCHRASSQRQSHPFDTLSLHSVASEEFMESDDELISINSDSNISASLSLSSTATRHSSKRKRTTTLSADLEVESLFSASGDDSFSSGDNHSVSDLSGNFPLSSSA